MDFRVNGTERMRLDSSGNLLVGKTSAVYNTAGTQLAPDGQVFITGGNQYGLAVNRTTADGDVVLFSKDGATVGSIGTKSGDLNIGTGDVGLQFWDGGDSIYAWNTSNDSGRDAAVDLGYSGVRFKDLYLSSSAIIEDDASSPSILVKAAGQTASTTPTASIILANGSLSSNASAPAIISYRDADYSTAALRSSGLKFQVTRSNAGVEAMTINSLGRVGIGTDSPSAALNIVKSGLSTQFRVSNTESDATTKYGAIVGSHYTNAEEPIAGMLMTSSSSVTGGSVSIGGGISAANAVNNILFYTAANNTTLTGSERMRITPSGELLLNKTSASVGTDGVQLRPSSYSGFSATSTTALFVNRNTDDGDVVEIGKNGVKVGSIGTAGADVTIGTGDTGLRFRDEFDAIQPHNITTNGTVDGVISLGKIGATFKDLYLSGTANVGALTASYDKTNASTPIIIANDTQADTGQYIAMQLSGSTYANIGITETVGYHCYIASGNSSTTGYGLKFSDYIVKQAVPCRGDGSEVDNVMDLGNSSARFDDIYATNGTIQTSDRNEKQDIQALTDAEQRVATACKGLIRRFRWQDAVEEKGDDARLHFGVIAQDLQDAFEAEGLDAGDYGMFISSTWEDDDGVEQTRLGVRYNELLAFIITTL
jgi:hypothetical protein